MNLLIVDPDRGIQEYYRNMLESEFRKVGVDFASSASEALGVLDSGDVDLVLTEALLGGSDANPAAIFDFIDELTRRRMPCIVVSAESSERMIVECLRAGALDFVSKQNIKLGYLAYVIARGALEADRWLEIQNFARNLPRREEFDRINARVRGFLYTEHAERRRLEIQKDERADKVFEDGRAYHVIYLYCQLFFPEQLKGGDERRFLSIQERVLDKVLGIPPRYNGRLWTRKEDGCFFAFQDDDYTAALLSAIEIRASLNIFNMTIENLPGRIHCGMGLSSGETVYREDKSRIYSEALNLSAHMAINQPEKGVLLSEDVYSRLGPRARKYFFSAGQYEGRNIYKFERIA